jgi:hypothetical protein
VRSNLVLSSHLSLGLQSCYFPSCCSTKTPYKSKSKVHTRAGHEGPYGEYMYTSTLSFTSALDGVGGQRHALVAIPPGKAPGTHCIRDWVDPRVGVDRCGKSRLPPGFDPRTVQPVSSRYADCVIPAHTKPPYTFLFSPCTLHALSILPFSISSL